MTVCIKGNVGEAGTRTCTAVRQRTSLDWRVPLHPARFPQRQTRHPGGAYWVVQLDRRRVERRWHRYRNRYECTSNRFMLSQPLGGHSWVHLRFCLFFYLGKGGLFFLFKFLYSVSIVLFISISVVDADALYIYVCMHICM